MYIRLIWDNRVIHQTAKRVEPIIDRMGEDDLRCHLPDAPRSVGSCFYDGRRGSVAVRVAQAPQGPHPRPIAVTSFLATIEHLA